MVLCGALGAENSAKGGAAMSVINIATVDPKITLDDPSEHYFHLHLEGDGLVLKVPRRMLENLKARVDEALKDAERINAEYRHSMQKG